MNKFSLSESFLENYRGTQPKWGFGNLSYFTYKRTYSRQKEDGSKEEYFDTVKRVIEGTYQIQLNYCNRLSLPWNIGKSQRSAQKMFKLMWDFKFTPPGRGYWMMGTPIVTEGDPGFKSGACLTNCSFVSTQYITTEGFGDPFAWAADMLMLGVGVGFDTLGAGKITISKPIESEFVFVIPDSREGWVDAVRILIDSYHGPKNRVKFVYDQIRGPNLPIKGFGGTTSGPGPLKEGLENIRRLLDQNIGKPLSSVVITDIMNYIGKFVVSGNVRRTAELALGDINDTDFMNMKNPDLYSFELTDRRWASNNSAIGTPEDNFSPLVSNVLRGGDTGIVLLSNCQNYGRFKDGFIDIDDDKYDPVAGVNPCVTEDTWIATKDGHKQVKDLLKSNQETYLINGKEYKGTGFFCSGIKKVYKLSTREGYSVKLTGDHKVLSERGWIEAKNLIKSDKILLNKIRNINWGNKSEESVENGYLVGHLIGDGTFDPSGNAILSVWTNDSKSEINYIENIIDKFNTRSDFLGFRKETKVGTVDKFNLSCKALTNLVTSYEVCRGNKTITNKIESENSDFYRGFIAGILDTDGSIQGNNRKGVSIRISNSDRNLLDGLQRMLLRLGITSTIYLRREEGYRNLPDSNRFPKQYSCKPSYDLVISRDCILEFKSRIPIQNIEKKEKLERLINSYKRNIYKSKFVCRFLSLEEVSLEKVYDVSVPDVNRFDGNGIILHNCGEIPLQHKELCNIVETYPANHDSAEEYYETLKYAYLYAKTVCLVPTHDRQTNSVIMRNRRIGISQSGIQQAINKFGHRHYFSRFCDQGYGVVKHWDKIYSRWFGVPTSIKTTTVKPSGTVSLLAGATPGIHWTHSEYYMRAVRLSASSELVKPLEEANYKIELDVTQNYKLDMPNDVVVSWDELGESDKELLRNSATTLVAYFPVKEKNFTKDKGDVSIWEQMSLVKEIQHTWADNSVSVTVTVRPEDYDQLNTAIQFFTPYVKTLSFLLLSGHKYKQAPYTKITREEYEEYANSLKELNLDTDNEVSIGEKFCTNDSCTIN